MDFSDLNNALGGMDPAELALGAGLVGVIGTLMVIGAAVWFFVSAIGYYQMFRKSGQRGWFAFIPLLRDFALFKMSWTLKAFVISTVLLAVFECCNEEEQILAGLLAAICGIIWLVMQVKLMLRVAKSFGKGTGWALLLIFVPFVATLILGFGSAEYLGNPEGQAAEEEIAPIEEA